MKLTIEDLNAKLEQAAAKAPVGSMWQHFKGGIYVVLSHSIDTENMNTLINYRRIGGPDFDAIVEANVVFSRPVLSWFSVGTIPGTIPVHVDRFIRLP